MNNNILGIFLSFIFVFSLIFISSILGKKNLLSNEGTRKFIHIGVSNWWIIAMIYFDSKLYAIIVPTIFIILNYLSYRLNIVKSMERDGSKNDLGTVYFPISLLILVLMTFSSFSHPYIGAIGILVMGYGDGLAAIIGKKYGKIKFHVFGNEKSFAGSLTMFLASFIVTAIILAIYSPDNLFFISFYIAIFSTLIEAISPFGLDNLTVPILTSIFYQLCFAKVI